MATSIFGNLAQEGTASQGLARSLSQSHRNDGIVLFHSTFDGTYDGWRDHYNAQTPRPPLSLTAYPVVAGTHAMMLGAGPTNRNVSAYKNLSRWTGDSGLVTFSTFLAHGNYQPANLLSYGLVIDTQAWDDTFRSFFALTHYRDESTGASIDWRIRGNNDTYISIPGTTDVDAGDNENKFNFDYVELTVDLAANNGTGGYVSCQINHMVFDLSGLGGSASEAPQTGTNPVYSFAGGLNFGITMFSNTAGTAFIVADQAVGSIQI